MAVGTGIGNADGNMVWIDRLGKCIGMAITAQGRSTRIPVAVAAFAGCVNVRTGKREDGCVVIKTRGSITGWMAGKAGGRIVAVSADSLMFTVHVCLVVLMAVDAAELAVIRWIGVAVGTKAPFSVVLARIYREILSIMIKRGRNPGTFGMAGLAFCRKLGRGVWRIGGLVITFKMTSGTGIRG